MRPRRVRHPGGVSWVWSNENVRGEWSFQLEPEGLSLDSYHPGESAHAHDPADPSRRVPIRVTELSDARRIVMTHLWARGRIRFPELVEELGGK